LQRDPVIRMILNKEVSQKNNELRLVISALIPAVSRYNKMLSIEDSTAGRAVIVLENIGDDALSEKMLRKVLEDPYKAETILGNYLDLDVIERANDLGLFNISVEELIELLLTLRRVGAINLEHSPKALAELVKKMEDECKGNYIICCALMQTASDRGPQSEPAGSELVQRIYRALPPNLREQDDLASIYVNSLKGIRKNDLKVIPDVVWLKSHDFCEVVALKKKTLTDSTTAGQNKNDDTTLAELYLRDYFDAETLRQAISLGRLVPIGDKDKDGYTDKTLFETLSKVNFGAPKQDLLEALEPYDSGFESDYLVAKYVMQQSYDAGAYEVVLSTYAKVNEKIREASDLVGLALDTITHPDQFTMIDISGKVLRTNPGIVDKYWARKMEYLDHCAEARRNQGTEPTVETFLDIQTISAAQLRGDLPFDHDERLGLVEILSQINEIDFSEPYQLFSDLYFEIVDMLEDKSDQYLVVKYMMYRAACEKNDKAVVNIFVLATRGVRENRDIQRLFIKSLGKNPHDNLVRLIDPGVLRQSAKAVLYLGDETSIGGIEKPLKSMTLDDNSRRTAFALREYFEASELRHASQKGVLNLDLSDKNTLVGVIEQIKSNHFIKGFQNLEVKKILKDTRENCRYLTALFLMKLATKDRNQLVVHEIYKALSPEFRGDIDLATLFLESLEIKTDDTLVGLIPDSLWEKVEDMGTARARKVKKLREEKGIRRDDEHKEELTVTDLTGTTLSRYLDGETTSKVMTMYPALGGRRLRKIMGALDKISNINFTIDHFRLFLQLKRMLFNLRPAIPKGAFAQTKQPGQTISENAFTRIGNTTATESKAVRDALIGIVTDATHKIDIGLGFDPIQIDIALETLVKEGRLRLGDGNRYPVFVPSPNPFSADLFGIDPYILGDNLSQTMDIPATSVYVDPFYDNTGRVQTMPGIAEYRNQIMKIIVELRTISDQAEVMISESDSKKIINGLRDTGVVNLRFQGKGEQTAVKESVIDQMLDDLSKKPIFGRPKIESRPSTRKIVTIIQKSLTDNYILSKYMMHRAQQAENHRLIVDLYLALPTNLRSQDDLITIYKDALTALGDEFFTENYLNMIPVTIG